MKKNCLICLILLTGLQAVALSVPRSNLIIHGGVSHLYMTPSKDSSVQGFHLKSPGLYVKLSGETYKNATDFVHFDISLSLNWASMDHGYARVSRMTYSYGIGKTFDRVKFTLSPGLCYSQTGYLNELTGKSVAEARFAPSLGLQTDLVLVNSQYRYLGLFVEGSFMFAVPSRWVHQLSAGISWKPSFRKNDRAPVTP
jgi:hypothetical protein